MLEGDLALALTPSAGSGRLGAVTADLQEGRPGHSLWWDTWVYVPYWAGRGIPTCSPSPSLHP